eukprot:3484413-Pyramimonas_sp.AAC.3
MDAAAVGSILESTVGPVQAAASLARPGEPVGERTQEGKAAARGLAANSGCDRWIEVFRRRSGIPEHHHLVDCSWRRFPALCRRHSGLGDTPRVFAQVSAGCIASRGSERVVRHFD